VHIKALSEITLLHYGHLRSDTLSLLEISEDVTRDMTTFTEDPAPIEARRDRIARAIAELKKL